MKIEAKFTFEIMEDLLGHDRRIESFDLTAMLVGIISRTCQSVP
jgi:hypothetical protein